MPATRNAWVSFAIDETTALQTLVLIKCLRRVLTSADIVILICPDLPSHLKIILHEICDIVMVYEPIWEQSTSFIRLIEARIFVWQLTMYEKCVVLDPSALILKNLDELFTCNQISAFANDINQKKFDFSLYVMEPSSRVYRQIYTLLMSSVITTNDSTIESVVKETDMTVTQLSLCKYERKLNSETWNCVKLWNPIGMDKMEKQWFQKFKAGDTGLSNDYAKVWWTIFESDVLPIIEYNKEQPLDTKHWRICHGLNMDNTIFQPITKSSHNYMKDSIAIIGHSIRLPCSNNIGEFWQLLESGGDGIISIPIERLTEQQISKPRFTTIKAGFLKCPIDEFDAKFFGISPREAAFMDPQQRILLEVAWEALENAGINPESIRGSNTGVFSGIWTHEYEQMLNANSTVKNFNHAVLGNTFGATSGRISYFLGLNGPNMATESGCSSSMVALHLACASLKKKETNLALATGVNLLISVHPKEDISILANDGHCKTFDEKADGFGRAEGAVVVVLKRLSDAVRDGDRILSIIRGSAVSSEGTTSSFGTPSKFCQEIAIKEALNAAGVKPEDVDYVEAHGTGTPIGDPVEFSAISSGYKGRRCNPLIISSGKTNIGHTESAAGLAGLIKVILSIENELIPAHRNLTVKNPNIDLEELPAMIPLTAVKWPKHITPYKRRMAGLSSFGISGTNVHVILEEPPNISKTAINVNVDEITQQILVISAKCDNALKDLISSYSRFLNANSPFLRDVCYTAATGRQHFRHRYAIVVKNLEDAKSELAKPILSLPDIGIKNPKIAFLFTGQGSQYCGMANNLYQTSYVFRTAFTACNTLLHKNYGIDLKNVIWGNENYEFTSLESQLSIFCVGYCLLHLWKSLGVKPDYILGHSVGEFIAAVAAEIISIEDALQLLSHRCKLIDTLPPGGMLVVRSNKEKVETLIEAYTINNHDDWLDIAVINSDYEVVVAGRISTLTQFSALCSTQNVKTQFLAAKHAFHSRDMDSIVEKFKQLADLIKYKASKYIYVSGTTGKILKNGEMGGEYWVNHLRRAVNFIEGVKLLREHDCNIYIEVGPHPILLPLGMSNTPATNLCKCIWLPSIRRNEDNWLTLLSSVAKLYENGSTIDWNAYFTNYSAKKIALPHYSFQRQKYWLDTKSETISKQIHPLLGQKIPLAVIRDNIFENTLCLNDFSYLKDHQVANVIILPAAGFLEIIVAAGNHIFKQNKNYVKISVYDFLVEAPLELLEEKNHKIQVVASDITIETAVVRIFVYANVNGYNDEKCWKLFSSGKVTTKSIFTCTCSQWDIGSNVSPEEPVHDFYRKLSDAGIKFGAKFQSISNIWADNVEITTKVTVPDLHELNEYMLHPIILDAMFQTFGLATIENGTDLYLPIGVNNFSIISKSSKKSAHYFVHIYRKENVANTCVHLYDEHQSLVATLQGLQLAKTSVTSFLNVIAANKNKLPGLYTEVWRQRDGIYNNRIDFSLLPDNSSIANYVYQNIEMVMPEYDEIKYFSRVTYKLCSDIIQLVFLQAGWKPNLNDSFTSESFVTNLLLSPMHSMLINRFLSILKEDRILGSTVINEETNWTVLKQLPSIENAKKTVDDTLLELVNFVETPCIKNASENLLEVLQAKRAGINVLFDDPKLNPLIFYTDCKLAELEFLRVSYYIQHKFESIKSHGSMLRIIEVGAGSGSTMREVVKALKIKGIPFSYTFTDITPVFLEKAQNQFGNISEIEYRLLNIETDPKYQDFIPFSYDIVIAANVIHATEYLTESIKHVRQLLAPSGILVLQEMLAPVRLMDMIFGMLDGYWRFKDFDIRVCHPCVNFDTWKKLLIANGFESSMNLSNSDEASQVIIAQASDSFYQYQQCQKLNNIMNKCSLWIIFAPKNQNVADHVEFLLKSVGESACIIYNQSCTFNMCGKYTEKVDLYDSVEVKALMGKLHLNYDIKGIICLFGLDAGESKLKHSKAMLYIAQYICSNINVSSRLVVASIGAYVIGDQENGYPWTSTLWGQIRTLKIEHPDINCQIVDLDPDEDDTFELAHQIFSEIWRPFNEGLLAIRKKRRFTPKLVPLPISSLPSTLPNGRYEIVLPDSKQINDLSFRLAMERELKPNEVEMVVKASALNFKDILTITKPDQYYTDFEAVGMDFSGIVTQVGKNVSKYKKGDELFGIAGVSAVASHVILSHDVLVRKPSNFTFAEASTLPSIFLTAYHCLIEVGKLKVGETILIHVASGGVGLIAIQIAKYIGAKIITTAGNMRKRTYLKSLGIHHVFHSRDLSFSEEINKVTAGNGVDLVLNSLTSNGFKEATLSVCAKNARFIEMGKMNIWKSETVANLRPDIKYTIINLERLPKQDVQRLVYIMTTFTEQELIKPLPYTSFPVSQVKTAFNYFLKAQHIGKVVVTMPELKENFGRYFMNDLLFNDNVTYLVTGGLGGIGLQVAKWMIDCGARCIVLVARSSPDASTKNWIRGLNERGFNVVSKQVDVGSKSECKILFDFIKSELPPLRGVIHSAGSLSDAVIPSQTWEKYQTVFNAKVDGSWNLHEFTKKLQMEHFVLFSSMAALWGTFGQSNHSAANVFMDSLAHYRHTLGLPAQTINWGAWSDVGSATESIYGREGIFGLKPFTATQGIAALKFALTTPYVQVSPMQLDAVEFARSFPYSTNYVSELLEGESVSSSSNTVHSDEFWNNMQYLTDNEKINYIQMCVETIVRHTLKLPDSEKVDEYQKFSEMGLDSLMAVEMRNKLQKTFGSNCQINPTSLLDYPTINSLSLFLADMVNNTNKNKGSTYENKNVNDAELIKMDSILSSSIQKVDESIKPSEIRNILLTGATGHFAPYLLCELLKEPNVYITCLVRGSSIDKAMKRLQDNLKKFDLLNTVAFQNVSVVLGDIAENNMGFGADIFNQLSKSIDAVVHCAVKANHVEKYVSSKSKKDIRSVNVLGTHEVLKFASTSKTKRVYFTSSYTAANVLTEEGLLSEELPGINNDGEGLGSGYPLTKFVGEKLISQAIQRGIPCTVFRFATMIGHSETGHFTLDANSVMNVLLSALRFKMFRHIPGGWYSIPIDIAAKVSSSIFYNDAAPIGLYNIFNSNPMTSEQFVNVSKESGFDVSIVSNNEFQSKMLAHDNPLLNIFKESFGSQDPLEVMMEGSTVFRQVLQKECLIFKVSNKLCSAVKDVDVMPHPADTLKRMILYGKSKNMFASLGINESKA